MVSDLDTDGSGAIDKSEITDNAAEDDLTEATQAICGKLFLELWSSDTDNGFPMPMGCYYKQYGSGSTKTRELFIVFDAKNGLRPDKDYQIVVNGKFSSSAVRGGHYLEIFTMDDVTVNP